MARKLALGEDDKMCISADCSGDVIAIGYEDGFVKIWDLRCEEPIVTGRCGNSDESHDDVASLVFANQTDTDLHIACGPLIYRQDLRQVSQSAWHEPRFALNEDDINQIAVSANDEVLATCDDSGQVVLVDLKNSRLLSRLRRHQNVAYVVQFRPGRPRELISGGYDCKLIHWDALKSRVLGCTDLSVHSDPDWKLPGAFNPSYVLSAQFAELNPGDASTNQLLVGSENGNLHCFRCIEHRLQHRRVFRAHQLGVTQIRYLRNHSMSGDEAKNVVVTGGNDERIHFWNVNRLYEETDGVGSWDRSPIHTIEHGEKINWLSQCGDKHFLVCDTGSQATIMPIPV